MVANELFFTSTCLRFSSRGLRGMTSTLAILLLLIFLVGT